MATRWSHRLTFVLKRDLPFFRMAIKCLRGIAFSRCRGQVKCGEVGIWAVLHAVPYIQELDQWRQGSIIRGRWKGARHRTVVADL